MTKLIPTFAPKINVRSLFLTALAALVLFPATGYARDDDRHDRNRGNHNSSNHGSSYNYGHGHGQSYYKPNHWDNKKWNNNSNHRYTYTRINLSSREESRVRRDLQRYYYDRCGSVTGRNSYGCQPVGYRYSHRIGQPLPPHAVVWSLPHNVYYNLPSPSYGTRYAWVDRDLLLISEDRGTVLDILLRL